MAKSFKILRDKMSPSARDKAKQKAQEIFQEIEMLSETEIVSEDNQESSGRPPPANGS